jgi:hypothetical protein
MRGSGLIPGASRAKSLQAQHRCCKTTARRRRSARGSDFALLGLPQPSRGALSAGEFDLYMNAFKDALAGSHFSNRSRLARPLRCREKIWLAGRPVASRATLSTPGARKIQLVDEDVDRPACRAPRSLPLLASTRRTRSRSGASLAETDKRVSRRHRCVNTAPPPPGRHPKVPPSRRAAPAEGSPRSPKRSNPFRSALRRLEERLIFSYFPSVDVPRRLRGRSKARED